MVDDYFVDIVHFLSTRMALLDMIVVKKKQLVAISVEYQLIVGNLYKLGAYVILRECVLEYEIPMILT